MKNSRGITLIALVVTIVILIILAGVSVNLVLGQNGIINKAKEASIKYEKASEKEKLQLAIAELEIKNQGKKLIQSKEELEDAIENMVTDEDVTVEKVSNQTYKVLFRNSRSSYNVSANGTIREKIEPTPVYMTYNQADGVYVLSNDKIDNTSIKINDTYQRNWGTKVKIENRIAPTSTEQWFSGVTEIEGLENLDMSNVTNMKAMFNSCSAPNLDLSSWDTSNVTDMSNMFMYCTATNINVSNWDVSNVTNMEMMFNNCYRLQEIKGLSNWDVSNVTNMKDMFSYCDVVTTLGKLDNWDVSNVTNMFDMFSDCDNLVTVGDLSNWNVSNVTDMTNMFADCAKLVTPGDLSKWNVGNVTKIGYMFGGCYELTTVGNLNNWNITNISNISSSGMFSGSNKVSPIPSWYTE